MGRCFVIRVSTVLVVLTYGLVAFATYLGAAYEMEGHGLHPAVCVVFCAVVIVAGLYLATGSREKPARGRHRAR